MKNIRQETMYGQYRRKTFWMTIAGMVVVGGLLAGSLYYAGQWLAESYPSDSGQAFLAGNLSAVLSLLQEARFFQWVLPCIMCFFLLSGIVFWAMVTFFTAGFGKKETEDPTSRDASRPGKKDFIDQKIERERKHRLFLHSLSILQREGRLLDFFDEDLTVYEDSQIGAAVRSIQEDCKKAVKKYIDPKPVVQGGEGDEITIEEGFDIDAINLVGNVSGHPPFKGVIRHPGWRAGKKDVPKLSDIQDSGIMTPAEIEIN